MQTARLPKERGLGQMSRDRQTCKNKNKIKKLLLRQWRHGEISLSNTYVKNRFSRGTTENYKRSRTIRSSENQMCIIKIIFIFTRETVRFNNRVGS